MIRLTLHRIRLMIAVTATAILAVSAVTLPEVRNPSLAFAVLGMVFTARLLRGASMTQWW